jgi:hypothetical protein
MQNLALEFAAIPLETMSTSWNIAEDLFKKSIEKAKVLRLQKPPELNESTKKEETEEDETDKYFLPLLIFR